MSAAPSSATLLERLQLPPDARAVVIHCDDIGMCHAANDGAFEALLRGPATCGSIMVPCPWFEEAAAMARPHPELDLGVHLTLTAEWESYCWGPVASADRVPSLVDARGAFPRTTKEVLQRADPRHVEIELRAQIERALEAGIDVTHLDSHMGSVLFPPLADIYIALGIEYRLPIFVVPPRAKALETPHLAPMREAATRAVMPLAEAGHPLLDEVDANSLHFEPGGGLEHNLARLRGLEAGVTYLICHPARGGAELDAISADAHCRDFERSFYGGDPARQVIEEEGLVTLGMRALRDLIRG